MSYQHDGRKEGVPSLVQTMNRGKRSVDLRLVPSTFAEPDTLVSRFGAAMTGSSVGAHIVGARVLVMGFDREDASDLTRMLRKAGVKVCATCRDIAQLSDLSAMIGTFTHVVVRLEAFAATDDAVSALLQFRARQKDMVVILISNAVEQDDLLHDRKWICDATLRAPVSFNRLCDGLLAAWVNNKCEL